MFGKKSLKKNPGGSFIKHRGPQLFKLLQIVILVLAFCLHSCADTEEDLQTFLEKNDGSEWLLRNDTLKVYIRINNNETNLIEQWYYNEESSCFDYNPNIFVPGDCHIKENSYECFMIAGDIILSDYESMTFTNQGTLLRVDIILSEWTSETVFFSKSTTSVDELKNCKPVDKMTCLFFKSCR